jgi:hypothetical protein
MVFLRRRDIIVIASLTFVGFAHAEECGALRAKYNQISAELRANGAQGRALIDQIISNGGNICSNAAYIAEVRRAIALAKSQLPMERVLSSCEGNYWTPTTMPEEIIETSSRALANCERSHAAASEPPEEPAKCETDSNSSTCVVTPVTCGVHTHKSNGRCVPNGR